MKSIALPLVIVFALTSAPLSLTQEKVAKGPEMFQNVQMLVPHGNKVDQTAVRIRFNEGSLTIESRKGDVY